MIKFLTYLVFEPLFKLLKQIPDRLRNEYFYFCINLGYNFCAFLGRECLTNVIKCSTNLAFEPICELLNQIPYPLQK